jgi:hypothetical protein
MPLANRPLKKCHKNTNVGGNTEARNLVSDAIAGFPPVNMYLFLRIPQIFRVYTRKKKYVTNDTMHLS